jgi:DNA-directed RNA polymerase subunit RPC12/RpoP
MAEVSSTSCVICGAPLDPPEGATAITCSYCGNKLTVQSGQTSRTGDAEAPHLPVELLQGYTGGDFGQGQRFGPAEMASKSWQCFEHGVWPIDGVASSEFGMGWKAISIAGAPAVYPSCGDRRGAWAPGSRISRVEWIEAHYDPDAPAVNAIRVFETCMPGATFAVTVRELEREEQIVYKGAPKNLGNKAQVLEIPLDPPRKLQAVRAYVSNELGAQWSEIDTIGLVATEPVPESMRRKPQKPSVRFGLWLAAAVIVLGLLIFGGWALTGFSGTAAPVETPTARIGGATMMTWNAQLPTMTRAGTVWAYGAQASTAYGSTQWTAAAANGPPEVYPAHRDDGRAWAPLLADGGQEWIQVQFMPTAARAIVVVETFHPGALVRIDDLSVPSAPVVLWEGSTTAIQSSRVLSLELPAPRNITILRLVADTSRVAGWYAIDAVGLVP